MKNDASLDGLRRDLDAVNLEILEALMRRFEIVKQVQKRKERHGLPLYDQQRVQLMLERLQAQWSMKTEGEARSSEDWRLIEGVFHSIFSAALELQAISMAAPKER
jgi:chorismate mutase